MRKAFICLCCVLTLSVYGDGLGYGDESNEPDHQITKELNAYWGEVSRSVREGDFEGYAATCHPEGVLVSGIKQSSYPLSKALEGWKQGFDDTRANKMKASVEFRFSQRLHDATTAHETGIFRYATTRDGQESADYVHFEGLLRKSPHGWLIVMEYQKSVATEAEWKALAPQGDRKRH